VAGACAHPAAPPHARLHTASCTCAPTSRARSPPPPLKTAIFAARTRLGVYGGTLVTHDKVPNTYVVRCQLGDSSKFSYVDGQGPPGNPHFLFAYANSVHGESTKPTGQLRKATMRWLKHKDFPGLIAIESIVQLYGTPANPQEMSFSY
jgi:hypothetical protein